MPPKLNILAFQAEDQAAVKDLILAGLVEHYGFLDPTKNPDLNDIAITYADATFLVAWLDGEIVGTGALMPRSPETAEIVRMSVAAKMRRKHIGRQILQELIQRARKAGYRRVILETTETWSEVIQFYLNHGFRITYYQDGDVFFELDLEKVCSRNMQP
jgi:putative acetyltransferase